MGGERVVSSLLCQGSTLPFADPCSADDLLGPLVRKVAHGLAERVGTILCCGSAIIALLASVGTQGKGWHQGRGCEELDEINELMKTTLSWSVLIDTWGFETATMNAVSGTNLSHGAGVEVAVDTGGTAGAQFTRWHEMCVEGVERREGHG